MHMQIYSIHQSVVSWIDHETFGTLGHRIAYAASYLNRLTYIRHTQVGGLFVVGNLIWPLAKAAVSSFEYPTPGTLLHLIDGT